MKISAYYLVLAGPENSDLNASMINTSIDGETLLQDRKKNHQPSKIQIILMDLSAPAIRNVP